MQQIDPDAYKLLCRLGCYRYQDVPTVPLEGLLCLLWDVSENQQRRVVKALRDRSLVDYENGEFWLHPAIRTEAISRLRSSEDWEMTNQKAADFWTNHLRNALTPQEGLQELEACYHYIAAENWEEAARVLFRKIHDAYIVSYLRAFGYMHRCIEIIVFLKNKSDLTSISRGRLWVCLADFYAITGKLKDAISGYKEANNILSGFLENDEKMRECIYNKGVLALVYLNLKQYEILIDILQEIIPVAEELGTNSGGKFLAYMHSCLSVAKLHVEDHKDSLYHLNCSIDFQHYLENSSRLWIKGFGQYNLGKAFLGHNYLTEAIEVFEKLRELSEENSFLYLKGLAFSGFAEVYEKQGRLKKNQ